MDINKKISQFTEIEGFDNTTQIPVVQGSPLFNAKITPKKFVKAIGDDVMKELNLGKVDNTSDLDKPISDATRAELELKATNLDLDAHKNAENPHNISKGTINLDKVDNTSDLDKPISTATQEALDILEDRPLPDPIITMTETEYDNLTNKDPDTYYFITED